MFDGLSDEFLSRFWRGLTDLHVIATRRFVESVRQPGLDVCRNIKPQIFVVDFFILVDGVVEFLLTEIQITNQASRAGTGFAEVFRGILPGLQCFF